MSKGIALNVGLNFIDKTVYGTDGALKGCVNDAKAMQAIANSQGFETKLILNEEATRNRIVDEITRASDQLVSEDMFLLTLACHGSQIPSLDGIDDEIDGLDETWVLFDQQLIDDELNSLLSNFRAGVKILVISDSCHSGSMIRPLKEMLGSTSAAVILESFAHGFKEGTLRTTRDFPIIDGNQGVVVEPELRALDRDISNAEYIKDIETYKAIQRDTSSFLNDSVKASVILFSGCQDNQLSSDGDNNGLFTETLLKIWSDNYQGDYITLFKEIRGNMPPWQTPNYYKIGSEDPNFEHQKPFAIVKPTSNKEDSMSTNDPRFIETLAAAAASAAVSALIKEFASSNRGFGVSVGGGFQTPLGGGGFNVSFRELIQERLAKEGVIANRSVSPEPTNDPRFIETLAAAAASAAVSALIKEFASSNRGFGVSVGGGFQTPLGGGGFNVSFRELIQERLAQEGVIANRSVSPSSADRSFFEKIAEKIGEKIVDVIIAEF
jgi:hypothetical protein